MKVVQNLNGNTSCSMKETLQGALREQHDFFKAHIYKALFWCFIPEKERNVKPTICVTFFL